MIAVLLIALVAMPLPSSRAQSPAAQTIESDNPRVAQSGQWFNQTAEAASNDSYLYSGGSDNDTLSLAFVGASVEVIYLAAPQFGTLAIEVDGTVLRTVITTADKITYGQSAKIDYLTNESHALKVYAQAGGVIAVDAFVVARTDQADSSAQPSTIAPRLPCSAGTLVDGVAGSSGGKALSADGRYLYYGIDGHPFSEPANLYQLDRQTCVTTLVASLTGGSPSFLAASADGQHLFPTTVISFDLPIGCRTTFTTFHVDRTTSPVTVTQLYAATRDTCSFPGYAFLQGDLSADARYFVTGNAYDVIRLFDLTGGTAANLNFGGNLQSSGRNVRISGDGRYVFFATNADFAPASANAIAEIYVFDRQTPSMTLISVGTGGARLDGNSELLDVSGDGRYILYTSVATNAVAGDTNGVDDLFVYDRQTNTTTRVSVGDDESQANGGSYFGRFSSDAHLIAFESSATNLIANDTNGKMDIFLRDTVANATSLISLADPGTPANGHSYKAIIADGGSAIAFRSEASNLVPAISTSGFPLLYVAATSLAATFPGDRLALYDGGGSLRLYMNLLNTPASDNFQSAALNAPASGQGVMGDWDGDGLDTPGIYGNNGVFYYTNSLSGTPTWSSVWIGLLGRPPVAGHFNAGVNHDCIGAVDSANFPPYGTAFALYFTCDLTNGTAPALTFQWLSVVLPDSGGFTGTHQFAAGDFNNDGVDSIAVRRGQYIAFTNVAPTTLLSAFDQAQLWGTPSVTGGAEGLLVVGDFDLAAGDSFGVYYPNGNFYYRNSVAWNPVTYLLQQVGQPIGTPVQATTWR